MASKPPASEPPRRFAPLRLRAPSPAGGAGLLFLLALLLGLLGGPAAPPTALLARVGVGFFLPGLGAALFTGPLAERLGGRLTLRRSFLLAILSTLLVVPVIALWRLGAGLLPADQWVGVAAAVILAQGPVLWFRHMSLYGLSNPSHGASLAPALLQPILALAGLFILVGPRIPLLVASAAILLLGFLCSALLLRAADRPLRREFQVSGVGLIRPLLEHVASRDPGATRQLEEFFGRKAIPADVRVAMIRFRSERGPVATIALPTVHPGPFAAVGASDLPRKIAEGLGSDAGVVLVPHTPCNHDLDLPSEAEVDRIRRALGEVAGRMRSEPAPSVSPLLSPRVGSLVRVQAIGAVRLVLFSQAPAPSDDIDYAIVDPYYERSFRSDGPLLAFIDAHNSYAGDAGDLTYGSPAHRTLGADLEAAMALAESSARPGPLRAGAAVRSGYSVRAHGIGPEGIRALVLEAAGQRTAYVLIDGNNLLQGFRATIQAALVGLVEASEVMTTDNHVVHEVDGSVNALGERFEAPALAGEVRAVVEEALAGLTEVTVEHGRAEVRDVRVLGPAWTARLLTSLGDTMSVFAHAALTTFLLLLTSSLLVLAVVLGR